MRFTGGYVDYLGRGDCITLVRETWETRLDVQDQIAFRHNGASLCKVFIAFETRTACHQLSVSSAKHSIFQSSFNRSSKSSSSQPPFLLCTVIFSASCCCSLTAFNISLSCTSVTLLLSCPDLAMLINLFSTSSARDALTSRIRPSLSAASGSSIWERIEDLWSASRCLPFVSACYADGTTWTRTFVRRCLVPADRLHHCFPTVTAALASEPA